MVWGLVRRYECNQGTKLWHLPAFVTQFWQLRSGFSIRGGHFCRTKIEKSCWKWPNLMFCFLLLPHWWFFVCFGITKNGNGRQNRILGAKTKLQRRVGAQISYILNTYCDLYIYIYVIPNKLFVQFYYNSKINYEQRMIYLTIITYSSLAL